MMQASCYPWNEKAMGWLLAFITSMMAVGCKEDVVNDSGGDNPSRSRPLPSWADSKLLCENDVSSRRKDALSVWLKIPYEEIELPDGLLPTVSRGTPHLGSEEEYNLLRQWLEERAAYLDMFEEGLATQSLVVTDTQDLREVMRTVTGLMFFNVAGAKRFFREQEYDDALESLNRSTRMVDLIKRSDVPNDLCIYASTLERMVLETLRYFLTTSEMVTLSGKSLLFEHEYTRSGLSRPWRREFCARFLPVIKSIPADGSASEIAWRVARSIGDVDKARTIEECIKGHPDPFDETETRSIVGESIMAVVGSFTEPWNYEKASIQEKIHAETSSWPDRVVDHPNRKKGDRDQASESEEDFDGARNALRSVENPVGKLCARLWVLDLEQFYRWLVFRAEVEWNATRVIIAAKRFQVERGRLPDDLTELVAGGFLKEIPIDPFDHKPLRYVAGAGAVWSVGRDKEELKWFIPSGE